MGGRSTGVSRGFRVNEIKFHGRGGQGVVMASQMMGLAFFKAGMYPQCYSPRPSSGHTVARTVNSPETTV